MVNSTGLHTCSAPWPLTAMKRHPFGPSGFEASRGRLGQPIIPTCTFASTRRARHTAYCSPLRKPFVPSIGSRVHIPEGIIYWDAHSILSSEITYFLVCLHHNFLYQSLPAAAPPFFPCQVRYPIVHCHQAQDRPSKLGWRAQSLVDGALQSQVRLLAILRNLLRRQWDLMGKRCRGWCWQLLERRSRRL